MELTPAEKHYLALKEAQKRYYYKNREAISEQRKKKYREANPIPKPRGPRPKVQDSNIERGDMIAE